MIIEQNVPTPVRAWAECQVDIRNNERTIRLLEDGKPIDFDSYASIKVMGRARYREECCRPKIAALKQRNVECRERADRLRHTTVRLKYRGTICKEIELFRSIPVWRVLQGIPVQIEDLDQSEV